MTYPNTSLQVGWYRTGGEQVQGAVRSGDYTEQLRELSEIGIRSVCRAVGSLAGTDIVIESVPAEYQDRLQPLEQGEYRPIMIDHFPRQLLRIPDIRSAVAAGYNELFTEFAQRGADEGRDAIEEYRSRLIVRPNDAPATGYRSLWVPDELLR